MRPPREIAFRVKQELRNAYRYARPARIALAEQIRAHRFPILGLIIETGPEIHWRRDHTSGIETGLDYFRLIPYLDAAQAGDHKVIWELNRHPHMVILAQAYLFTGDRANLDEIQAQLESWFDRQPLPSRDQLGERFGSRVSGVVVDLGLASCGAGAATGFSYALALRAVGLFFAGLPKAARREQLGGQVMCEQMEHQIRNDGSHFEQSTYYHVYAGHVPAARGPG